MLVDQSSNALLSMSKHLKGCIPCKYSLGIVHAADGGNVFLVCCAGTSWGAPKCSQATDEATLTSLLSLILTCVLIFVLGWTRASSPNTG